MDKSARKPVRNFLVKRSLQAKIIIKILFLMIVTCVLTSVILGWYYTGKSHEGSFFYMSNDVRQDLELTSILGVVLPAVVSAQAVSVLLAFGIGLFSSRKVAVPLYKVEKWVDQLRRGNLSTKLEFREKDEFSDLATECNAATEFYRRIFAQVHHAVAAIDNDILDSPRVRQNLEVVKKVLRGVNLGESPLG